MSESKDDYSRFRGKCKEMSEAAVKADPTLALVRGHYFDAEWGPQQHWWCVRPDGTIFDPTAAQFPSKGAGEYVPFNGICNCEYCSAEVPEADAYFYEHHVYCNYTCCGRDIGLL